MSLGTVYMDSGNGQKEIMKDIAKVEPEGKGFWLVNLFGDRNFVEGTIQRINFAGGCFVTLESLKSA